MGEGPEGLNFRHPFLIYIRSAECPRIRGETATNNVKIKEVISNALTAFASQGFSFLLSILTSLLVPKVLGVEEYGYWQLFVFYASYTGFFHLGIADGLYLVEGGVERGLINKRKVNSAFWFALSYEIPLAICIVLICGLAGFNGNREFVIAASAIYMLVSNAWSVLGYVFQAMNETKLYSYAVMANKLAFLAPLAILLLFRCSDFEPFVVFYIISHCCSLAFCAWKGRDILKSGLYGPKETALIGISYIRVGIKLMLANIASMLILGVARFLIDAEWGIEAFGKLSFSLSMVNFFLAFVSQASMVLFPALRQSDSDERLKVYSSMREALTVILPAAYLFCFPMIWLIGIWLPQYASTLHYFVYLLPLCVFDGKMNLLGTTFFKVLRRENTLLKVNIATVLMSLCGTVTGIYVLRSVDAVICGVVIALAFRSLISEALISNLIGDRKTYLPLGEVLVSVGFVATGILLPGFGAMGCYAVIYAVFLFAFKDNVRNVLRSIVNLGKGSR